MKIFAADDLYRTLNQSVLLFIRVAKDVRLNVAML